MSEAYVPSLSQPSTVERSKSHRLPFLHKLKRRKSPSLSEELGSQSSSVVRSTSPTSPPLVSARLPSIVGVRENVSAAMIEEEYASLQCSIISHVRRFYAPRSNYHGVTQTVIEHASTGVMIPWPQIQSFLGDSTTILGTLSLCIAWTILSRSLLLKLGISNSSCSSFLPPEIVECFQSFSMDKGAITQKPEEVDSVNFALLSRWKQISATLLHSAYVENAFNLFDSRTANIERALNDLDPLLSIYADANHGKDARLSDLREVLRKGAKFAFTLFHHSSFWKFDWSSNRAIQHGKEDSQRNLCRIPSFETSLTCVPVLLTCTEIVIWPTLLRVMDSEGVSLQGLEEEGNTFGQKQYLPNFERGKGK